MRRKNGTLLPFIKIQLFVGKDGRSAETLWRRTEMNKWPERDAIETEMKGRAMQLTLH